MAKPFGIAHIRSTVIGNSLYLIFSSLGYKVVRLNHLGDWGTQFGKLIVAYKLWGKEEELEEKGINYLMELYQKFSTEEKKDASLTNSAREWFAKLESGDEDALELWELFREISIAQFKKYYDHLNIEFDSYNGEAYYSKKVKEILELVESKLNPKKSDGALILELENLPPLMLLKSDGASTYHIRDMCAAYDRIKKYNPEKIIYVVDSRQKLHFQQLFKALEMLGMKKEIFSHVEFGKMTYEGKIMATRTGNFLLLEEVLNKSMEVAKSIINEKNPSLKNKEHISKIVGIGGVIFGDLSKDRTNDIDFKWKEALNFEGETAAYIQYTHARIKSILRKYGEELTDIKLGRLEKERELLRLLMEFEDAVETASRKYKPHIIARYALDLAQAFNSYYQKNRILCDDKKERKKRVAIAYAVAIILKIALGLLGIEAPEEM